jgi:Mce-associated membrane protein
VTADHDDITESDAIELSESGAQDHPAAEGVSENRGAPTSIATTAPRRFARPWVVAAVLAVLLIASAGVTTWLYFHQYRPDQLVDTDAQQAVLKAANDGTIALLSYSPDTLDKDFSTAKSHLTGDFLSYYTNFTQQIVTPAAKQKAVKTSAAVIRKGIAEIHPDRAVVLVFLNQVTTSKENPDGSYTTSAVKVSMERHDGTWLISAFDPV